nr:carboxypeptidase-like regulatory domain-containing protein [Bacteroidota bacterium]
MKIKLFFIGIIVLYNVDAMGQSASGTVYELDDRKHKVPLVGVNVYWAHNLEGTATDNNGKFNIRKSDQRDNELVFSFVGYQKDTLHLDNTLHNLEIILTASQELEGIEVSAKESGTHFSRLDPILSQQISGAELQKAACCNLSESFETNASVDVSYSDAVTGAKQIQLLGLAGKYSQMMTENIPNFYGLANNFGLMYVPGTWMESIQVSKGTAAVVNGYESITGQINVEYKKPDHSERIYLNAFGDALGRIEGNMNAAVRLNDKWSTMIYGHASSNQKKHDRNGDGFLDLPLTTQYNIFHRWKYKSDHLGTQIGFQYIDEDRTGGQVDFNKSDERIITNPYGINIRTKRLQAFWKMGFVLNRPSTSIGFLNSYTRHDQDSYFGVRDYTAKQNSYYGNLVFQSYIGNSQHKYSAGVSYRLDDYDEML